jgi:hypothetical protein
VWAISDLAAWVHLRPVFVHLDVPRVSPGCPLVRPCNVPGRSQKSDVQRGCLSITLLEILMDFGSLREKQCE